MTTIKDFITFCAACNELLSRKGNMVMSNPNEGAYTVVSDNDLYTFNAAEMFASIWYGDTDEMYHYSFKGDNCFLAKNGVTIWHYSG